MASSFFNDRAPTNSKLLGEQEEDKTRTQSQARVQGRGQDKDKKRTRPGHRAGQQSQAIEPSHRVQGHGQ